MQKTSMPRATCKVLLGGKDVTDRMRRRLSELTITTNRDGHADEVTFRIDDTDGKVALPRQGVELEVMLGYEGTGVQLQGSYTVDEVEHAGAPDTITVTGRSAKLATGINTRKERSWSNTTVGHVVNVIAGENGLTPRVSPQLAAIEVTQIDQTESDIALLKRIGSMWDAVATVKSGNLVFAPIGNGSTVSGKALAKIRIVRSDGDNHRFLQAKRNAYTGVRAKWHDVDAASGKSTLAGDAGHVKVLRGDFASEEDANRAASAEQARNKRGGSSFEIDLARGRADVLPETPVQLSGWKPEIDATDWIIKEAKHTMSGTGGWTTHIELENRATAAEHPATAEEDDSESDDGRSDNSATQEDA